jgi:hypothetical protein
MEFETGILDYARHTGRAIQESLLRLQKITQA